LLEVFAREGLPLSLYTDRGSHYFFTPRAGGRIDKERPTQVGRALARLGIEHIPAYSPEARGRSERMFGTLQDRLVNELAHRRIGDIESANRFIREVYLPRHNARFAKAAELAESAFVAVADKGLLREIVCIEEERIVARDNTVAWGRLKLQLPESRVRAHYVKARVRVHEYPDGGLAVFHGPRCIARYTGQGDPLIEVPQPTSMTPCSAPSRPSPAGGRPRRPALTDPARGVAAPARVGTEKRPSGRTKKQDEESGGRLAGLG
jgi:hypothetical protein